MSFESYSSSVCPFLVLLGLNLKLPDPARISTANVNTFSTGHALPQKRGMLSSVWRTESCTWLCLDTSRRNKPLVLHWGNMRHLSDRAPRTSDMRSRLRQLKDRWAPPQESFSQAPHRGRQPCRSCRYVRDILLFRNGQETSAGHCMTVQAPSQTTQNLSSSAWAAACRKRSPADAIRAAKAATATARMVKRMAWDKSLGFRVFFKAGLGFRGLASRAPRRGLGHQVVQTSALIKAPAEKLLLFQLPCTPALRIASNAPNPTATLLCLPLLLLLLPLLLVLPPPPPAAVALPDTRRVPLCSTDYAGSDKLGQWHEMQRAPSTLAGTEQG